VTTKLKEAYDRLTTLEALAASNGEDTAWIDTKEVRARLAEIEEEAGKLIAEAASPVTSAALETPETLASIVAAYRRAGGKSLWQAEAHIEAWRDDRRMLVQCPKPDANGDWDVGELMTFCDAVRERMP